MFKFVKGIWAGNKLAEKTGKLCKDLVNYLILQGYDVRLPDTAALLKECYAFFYLHAVRANENLDTLGAKIVQSQTILRDWLKATFKASASGYDFDQAVKEVVDSLPRYAETWIGELLNDHPELKSQSLNDWMPAASARFAFNVGFWTDQRFGKTPKNFAPFLIGLLVTHVNLGGRMRIFNNKNNTRDKQKKFRQIALSISKELEHFRKSWFDSCLSAQRQSGRIDIRIINSKPAGKAESAMKACQLLSVTRTLATHQYIPFSDGSNFADVLWDVVAGPKQADVLELFQRYESAERDGASEPFRVASDVIEYIIGDPDLYETLFQSLYVPLLAIGAQVAIADEFRDEATKKSLMNSWKRNLAKRVCLQKSESLLRR